ncbi:hypothetical protein K9K77_02405 [Candidatus Babeliales bacterium]|nr:hypothetical protein [Candidatus Babeliales bacterium]
MKYLKLTLGLLLVASSVQAGSGKTFGAVFGGTVLGNIVGNAFTREPKVIHVTESSNSTLTNRALKNLQNEFDDFYADVKRSFKAVAEQIDTMTETITKLEAQLKTLTNNHSSSKTIESSSEEKSLWQKIKDIF